MRILHTADLHIREYNDPRWHTLRRIIDLGKSENADALVISGDLFESSTNAHKLRPKFRELFKDSKLPVLIISGNHDADAYSEGIYLGDSVALIQDLFSPLEIEGVFFWGFPYQDLAEEETLEALHRAADKVDESATNILLFHGELLDITEGWTHYGEEGRQRYLPVKLSYFQELPWQYILAGHFHTTFDVHQFKEGAFFIYPGSPISITRRELGIRHVNLFSVGEPPRALPLDAPYYEKLGISLNALERQNPMTLITAKLDQLPENAHLLVEIGGFFNGRLLEMTEGELQRALSRLINNRIEIVKMEFRDIQEIMDDDLFKIFLDRLELQSLEETEKRQILNLTLQAMMEAQI